MKPMTLRPTLDFLMQLSMMQQNVDVNVVGVHVGCEDSHVLGFKFKQISSWAMIALLMSIQDIFPQAILTGRFESKYVSFCFVSTGVGAFVALQKGNCGTLAIAPSNVHVRAKRML